MSRHPLATRLRWRWYRHRGLRWATVAGVAVLAFAAGARSSADSSGDRPAPPAEADREAPDGRSGVAALVPAGHRAIALPVTVAPLPVMVGDHVDVLVASADGSRSRVVARAARVVAAGEEVVTVALPAADATAAADGLAGGVVTLALHGLEP